MKGKERSTVLKKDKYRIEKVRGKILKERMKRGLDKMKKHQSWHLILNEMMGRNGKCFEFQTLKEKN